MVALLAKSAKKEGGVARSTFFVFASWGIRWAERSRRRLLISGISLPWSRRSNGGLPLRSPSAGLTLNGVRSARKAILFFEAIAHNVYANTWADSWLGGPSVSAAAVAALSTNNKAVLPVVPFWCLRAEDTIAESP